jgi:DNA-binding YbaB/EbfC family protein
MKNLGQMMKQAQEMQNKLAEMQEGLGNIEVTGQSGGGMIQVTLSGKSEARKIVIDPSLTGADDKEVLEDLLVAAFNDAKTKVDALSSEKMKELTGGIELPPGMQFPF